MSLAKFSVNQAIFVNLLFLIFVFAGGAMYMQLPVDVYPDLSLDEAWIQTPYVGASPESVEQYVTRQIEEEIQDIPGVTRIDSSSESNISRIFVKFNEDLSDLDYEAAFQELRNRLGQVTNLPSGAEEPLLTRITVSEVWPIVQVVIMDDGTGNERLIHEVTRDLKDKLRDIEGVSKIKDVGLREREIHILINKHALEQYQLSLQEVANVLRSSNQNIPGGSVGAGGEESLVIGEGNVEAPEDLGNVIIRKNPGGGHVYLRDIATIREGFQRRTTISRYMGKKCAFLYVAKRRNADSITIRNEVNDTLARYRETSLPPGVAIDLFADSTLMISSRLDVLKKNMAFGLVLVFTVLWMAVGARNSMLAVVGIPFSFLCAFIFMAAIKVSINGVSVFALVLISGMVVDDAIVVLENIYRHIQRGESIKQAVIRGTDEVAWPVVTSALTTIAAFLPLLIMTGMIGKFFSIIPKTVIVTLLASLFECLIILPSHYLHWGQRLKRHPEHDLASRPQQTRPAWRERAMVLYRQVVEQSIAHRYLSLAVLGALGLCTYQASRSLVVELFPSDFPTLVATFNIKPEASLEQTDFVCQKLMPMFDELKAKGYAKTFSSSVGFQITKDNQMKQRPNLAQIWSELHQGADGSFDPSEVMEETHDRMVEFARSHPEFDIENLNIWPIQDGPPIGKPVAIRVEHHDYDRLRRIAGRIRARLQQIPGVFDISDNLDVGQRELRVTLREQEASEFGLTFRDVLSTLSAANEGVVVGTYTDHDYEQDLDIKLMYHEDFRSSADDLLAIDIKSPITQALIHLRQVADLRYEQGYANHFHHNGKRAVVVTADVDTAVTDSERVNRIMQSEFGALAEGDDQLTISAGGQFKETRESFESLKKAGLIAIALMYLILAAQFKSYIQPAIVLSSLTFGTIGMIMGLVINGYPFSVITGIAMVGLFGVMVNDAILLVTFINAERGAASSVHEALVKGCMVRVRPIILTTVTTVAGLLPMAIGIGGYSKIWSPFATSICWGLTCATILILVLLPALYMIIEDLKALCLRIVRKYAPADESSPAELHVDRGE